jgi:3D (Asp-Asp-Asp) domain-containing protein
LVTKSVVTCAAGGALATLVLLGGLLAGPAYADHPTQSQPQAKESRRTRALGTFAVTAYTHDWQPDGSPTRTASGTVPAAGRTVAVDPRVIPFGSKIYIEGLGERIAEDSGGKIKGKRLDLFLPSDDHCWRFGVRRRQVRLVEQQ